MVNIKTIADEADMIVSGYAFTKCDLGYRVVNLHHPERTAVLSSYGEPLEMTMDDIELDIAIDIFNIDKITNSYEKHN